MFCPSAENRCSEGEARSNFFNPKILKLIEMETYEKFKQRNAAWNCEYGFGNTDKEMQKNYEIALAVEKEYQNNFCNTEEPKIGDIVEFCDGFEVYKHAKIVEGGWKEEHGLLHVCEHGSSFTNGHFFSTSGGAFHHIHKSLMQYVGTEENLVWTWGCHGSGAHQGIYFTLNVRKWIVPYEPVKVLSTATIAKGKNGKSEVSIRNMGDWYCQITFDSIKAFLAWAEYAGYKHGNDGHGTLLRKSPQRLVREYVCHKEEIPKNGKPLKAVSNGRIVDAWVVSESDKIITFVDNFTPEKQVKFGTQEDDERAREFWKYSGNPLGV